MARDVTNSPEVAAINPEWLSTALKETRPEVLVEDCRVEDVIQGAAVKVRVRLSVSDRGAPFPETVILKGNFGRHNPEWGEPTIANEMRAYSEIVARSDVDAPEVYFTGYHPTDGRALIMMEDLVARGVRFNSSPYPLSYAEAAAHLANIARFHAQWWEHEEVLSGSISTWITGTYTDGPLGSYLKRMLGEPYWSKYAVLPRHSGLPRAVTDPRRLEQALHRLIDIHAHEPVTVLHGDFHTGNTYQNPDGTGGAYDWTIWRGSWRHDVAYFIANALDVEDRREWERALVEHYVRALEANGVHAIGFEQAWLAYRQDLLYGLLIWLTNGDDKGQFQPETVNSTGATRHAWAAVDHQTVRLLTD